jgi:hypothetical protein
MGGKSSIPFPVPVLVDPILLLFFPHKYGNGRDKSDKHIGLYEIYPIY